MPPHSDIGSAAAARFDDAALLHATQPAAAVNHLIEGLRLAPHHGPGYASLANLLAHFGMPAEAKIMAETAVALMPEDPQTLLCLAAILTAQAEFAAAAELYQRVLTAAPGHPGVLSSLANCQMALGATAHALDLHARAVAAAPDDPDLHYNRADSLLAAGQLAAGWAEYEWRLQRASAHQRSFGPPWDGAPLGGRTILLHAEQGYGDTIQFARYAPMVAARGGRVVLEVPPALVRLMRTLPGVAEIVVAGDAPPPFDTHCPLLSLPRLFGTTLDNMPHPGPYLQADPHATASWRRRLPGDALCVGLVWAGLADAPATGMQRRSLALADLAPLAGLAGVRFISLQAGPAAAQRLQPPPGLDILDPTGGIEDFADTAALVAALDLVVTVDTAVAHLAGALGRPAWVLLRVDACWRWLRNRDDSPWYPTLRLYRQTRPLIWGDVAAQIRTELIRLQAARAAA